MTAFFQNKRLVSILFLLFLAVFLSGCASGGLLDRLTGGGEEGELGGAPVFSDTGGVPYTTQLHGMEKEGLREILRGSSQLIALEERLPRSLGALRRRADEDAERLKTALKSEGYYDGAVDITVTGKSEPAMVDIVVEPGSVYTLADFDIDYGGQVPDERPALSDLGIRLEKPARAPEILGAEASLLRFLERHGHPLANIEDRSAIINREEKTMRVRLRVAAGAEAAFGETGIEGAPDVKEDYKRALVTWEEGAVYDEEAVEATRRSFASTGLFSSIGIEKGDAVGADGKLPMNVKLSEAPPRSIGFGAKYSTSEGAGADASWEHRNLFGRNEKLRASLTVSELEQSLGFLFKKPRFLEPGQELTAEATLKNRNTEAFDEQGLTADIGIERPWRENWRLSAGVIGEYTYLKDEFSGTTFQLFGLPLTASRDTSDNALNPTEGTRLTFNVTPYAGTGSGALAFTKLSATGSAYHALDEEKRYVLAGQVRAGAILGEETDQIPANKRFYSGGGGSVRGFEYQSAGPLDAQNDPLGGRSLFEVKSELRIKATESIGVVPFVDGGSAFDSAYPDFQEKLRWAAGLGLRYFTDFGPIRLDVAVPLNKRDFDDDFQFYISIGQAF